MISIEIIIARDDTETIGIDGLLSIVKNWNERVKRENIPVRDFDGTIIGRVTEVFMSEGIIKGRAEVERLPKTDKEWPVSISTRSG
jgi:hypothetical protein